MKKKFLKLKCLPLSLIMLFVTISCSSQVKEQRKNAMKPNRLINEKSPYLLQHAYNPVEWYPWSDEAFQKAIDEDKPIFLSIGYSTCHWCHVMEKESFEDSSVAELLNKYFVSIKVDREERPDIDNYYMTVSQMLTGSGGWPLTIIMTPQKKPFFAGTYFPKESKFGRVGMLELLPKIFDAWKNKRNEINESAEKIVSIINSTETVISDEELDISSVEEAINIFKKSFDEENGGFGKAPKFPSAHNLIFLLHQYFYKKDPELLKIVTATLTKMSQGGIYDHIGFGFHRYSTDANWKVPHFEKMLYDQAMLILAYTEAYQATKNELFKQTAEEVIHYVLRDMTSADGGFYSAEDADSEGEEGKFYLWTKKELQKILNPNQLKIVTKLFDIKDDGNFIDQFRGGNSGENIFYISNSFTDVAKDLNLTEQQLVNEYNLIRKKLFEIREKRIHPHKDDKILTDWNGLMIAALAKAGFVFNNDNYLNAAKKSYSFINNNLLKEDKLLHRYRDGEAIYDGNIDDYSFVIWGLLNLYESTFEPEYLIEAVKLNETLNKNFWDDNFGGYFFTPYYRAEDLTRQKEIYDGAVPSGNSVQMLNLLRLAKLTGNSQYESYANNLQKAFSKQVKKYLAGYSMLLTAVSFALNETFEIVIVGKIGEQDSEDAINIFRNNYLPSKVLLFKSNNTNAIDKITGFTKPLKTINNIATVYVCKNFNCNLPTTDLSVVLKQLNIK